MTFARGLSFPCPSPPDPRPSPPLSPDFLIDTERWTSLLDDLATLPMKQIKKRKRTVPPGVRTHPDHPYLSRDQIVPPLQLWGDPRAKWCGDVKEVALERKRILRQFTQLEKLMKRMRRYNDANPKKMINLEEAPVYCCHAVVSKGGKIAKWFACGEMATWGSWFCPEHRKRYLNTPEVPFSVAENQSEESSSGGSSSVEFLDDAEDDLFLFVRIIYILYCH